MQVLVYGMFWCFVMVLRLKTLQNLLYKMCKKYKEGDPLFKTKLLKVVSMQHEAQHEAKAHVIVSCSADKSLILMKVLVPASACEVTSHPC